MCFNYFEDAGKHLTTLPARAMECHISIWDLPQDTIARADIVVVIPSLKGDTPRKFILATELKAEAVMTDDALAALVRLLQNGEIRAKMEGGRDWYHDSKGRLPGEFTKACRLIMDAVSYATESKTCYAILYNGRRYVVIRIDDAGQTVLVSKAFTPGHVDNQTGLREPSYLYTMAGFAMGEFARRLRAGSL